MQDLAAGLENIQVGRGWKSFEWVAGHRNTDDPLGKIGNRSRRPAPNLGNVNFFGHLACYQVQPAVAYPSIRKIVWAAVWTACPYGCLESCCEDALVRI